MLGEWSDQKAESPVDGLAGLYREQIFKTKADIFLFVAKNGPTLEFQSKKCTKSEYL